MKAKPVIDVVASKDTFYTAQANLYTKYRSEMVPDHFSEGALASHARQAPDLQ
jgi:hypothetical protein